MTGTTSAKLIKYTAIGCCYLIAAAATFGGNQRCTQQSEFRTGVELVQHLARRLFVQPSWEFFDTMTYTCSRRGLHGLFG